MPTNNAGDDEMRDTIELAREAGLEISHTPPFFIRAWEEELKEFADLVRADERNACAQVVEEYPHWLGMTAKAEIANAIRARGENT
jgi:hypothetical protein